MIVLSGEDVRSLLDLDQLVTAVGDAMVDLSAGRASMPPRGAALVPDQQGMLLAMLAFLPSSGVLSAKLVSLFPKNQDGPTHQALICCFDSLTGSPVAVMDGTYITAMRTPAGSVLATRLLARSDATSACVIGTGVQARAHLTLFSREPGIEEIWVAGRDRGKVEGLVEGFAGAGRNVKAASSIADAVQLADIVCLTTHAESPVLRREWLRPGAHVNSVGYNRAGEGEVDVETIRDSLLVVESRSAALGAAPAGAIDLLRAIERGAITADHIHAELGELVSGAATGRTDDEQITLYKSVGVAVQDAAAARLVVKAASRLGRGVTVAMEAKEVTSVR